MPRRLRRDPEPVSRRRGKGPAPPLEVDEIASRVRGPSWTAGGGPEGWEVKHAVGTKRYRCPYCSGWILPPAPHVVAWEVGQSEERRHYHGGCWVRHAAGRR